MSLCLNIIDVILVILLLYFFYTTLNCKNIINNKIEKFMNKNENYKEDNVNNKLNTTININIAIDAINTLANAAIRPIALEKNKVQQIANVAKKASKTKNGKKAINKLANAAIKPKIAPIKLVKKDRIEALNSINKYESNSKKQNIKIKNASTNKQYNKKINNKISEVEKKIKTKNINKSYNDYNSNILKNIKNNNHLLNDRYKLQKMHYYDKDLHNEMLHNEYLNELDNSKTFNKINLNIDQTIQTSSDIDSKIYNKSKKNQKLFKDAKTIASRFNKNSLINDYKNELDYYENAKTPWWYENY